MGGRRLTVLFLVAICCLCAAVAQAGVKRPTRHHQVFFADTPDELNIYRVYGAKDGRTLMLVGGIQGDEPGGFLSADLYTDISLAQGNLIVVPRANFYSIIKNHRGPDGDMNRQFGDPVTARRHERIVKILKGLMEECDLFLNLHDGSGFYRPTWQGPLANPQRYGQSLIADAAIYTTSDGRKLDLKGMAQRVLERVNRHIENPRYHLRFNNHRTAESTSKHKEQRLSATYYALTRCNVPAFGVETSKSLPNVSMKVRHHNLAINAFMEEIGVIPENPGSYVAPTEFKYLVVSVNDGLPVVVTKDSGLTVSKGDRVKVLHIEANCERGLTCDIEGLGSVNDLRQTFAISNSSRVLVRKDGEILEQVHIRVAPRGDMFAPVRSRLQYFLVEVEGERRLMADGEKLTLVKGDKLRLVDLLSNLGNRSGLEVNFKGYVPQGRKNVGEDRGYLIDTGRDLLPRWSRCGSDSPEGAECYEVVASQGSRALGSILVEVVPARLDYLVLKRKSGSKQVYNNGETVRAARGERLEVVDLKSNVSGSHALALALDCAGQRLLLAEPYISWSEDPLKRLYKRKANEEVKLVVLREEQAIGHIRLTVGGPANAGK